MCSSDLILRDLAGVERTDGAALLTASGGSVKLALLMALTGLDARQSALLLDRGGPSLRGALAQLRSPSECD